MQEEELIILWHGVDEYEVFYGTLEKAIADVKSERRYQNYGHKGATIIRPQKLYTITIEPVEKFYGK